MNTDAQDALTSLASLLPLLAIANSIPSPSQQGSSYDKVPVCHSAKKPPEDLSSSVDTDVYNAAASSASLLPLFSITNSIPSPVGRKQTRDDTNVYNFTNESRDYSQISVDKKSSETSLPKEELHGSSPRSYLL